MYGGNTNYHGNPYIQGTTVPCDMHFLVPSTPALLPVELHCDVPLTDGRPVVINWMVGQLPYFFLQPSLYVLCMSMCACTCPVWE